MTPQEWSDPHDSGHAGHSGYEPDDEDASGSDLADVPVDPPGGRHRQPRRPSPRPHRSTIAAALVVAVVVIMVIAAGTAVLLWRGEGLRQAWDRGVDAAPSGVVLPSTRERQSVTGTIQPIQDLTVGSCFQDLPEEPGPHSGVEVVDCAGSHDNQLVAVFELADREWPGDLVIADEAQRRCREIGGNVVERAGADRATWDFWVLVPTRQGWVLNDDRVVQCMAYDPAGPVEGDVLI